MDTTYSERYKSYKIRFHSNFWCF